MSKTLKEILEDLEEAEKHSYPLEAKKKKIKTKQQDKTRQDKELS